MKTILRTFAPLCIAMLAGCGGGGGGNTVASNDLAPPPAPVPARPVVAPAPETERVAEQVAAPEPLPDPAILLRSHDRLSLPDGFNAVLADEAMFLLANIPYRAPAGGGGAGLAVASLALQAGALALYTAERSEAYRANHAAMYDQGGEEVDRVHPEIVTHSGRSAHTGTGHARGGWGAGCVNARGECLIQYPVSPGIYDGIRGGKRIYMPIGDMPFVGEAMREGSEGVRTRGGVGLRYWSSGNREVPWLRFYKDLASQSEFVSETWSGYGAWQEWSGFGLVMQTHDHVWDLYDGAWYYSIAGGQLTGGLPSPEVAGTMRGAAIVMPDDLSYIADGAVELTVRLGASPSFDISMGDWQGYELTVDGIRSLPTAVSVPDLAERNIPIKPDGTFEHHPRNGEPRIVGAFYGPGGGEAAGVFDMNGGYHAGLRGSFGVRKPDEPQ